MDSIKKILLASIFICGFSLFIYAQKVTVSGKVTDSLNTRLQYANILAIPQSDNLEVEFTITEADGSYELGLAKNQSYELTVSFLDYKNQQISRRQT